MKPWMFWLVLAWAVVATAHLLDGGGSKDCGKVDLHCTKKNGKLDCTAKPIEKEFGI